MTPNEKLLLEFLNKNNSGELLNINNMLLNIFKNVDYKNDKEIHEASKNINKLLHNLNEIGFIKYSKNSLGVGNREDGYNWLEGTKISYVKAKITQKGIDYLSKERRYIETKPPTIAQKIINSILIGLVVM